jgi:hypothetical protein
MADTKKEKEKKEKEEAAKKAAEESQRIMETCVQTAVFLALISD